MDEWVVLLHVVTAFWFVAGLLGRNVTMARARTASDLRMLDELVTLSGQFERMMVIPGSIAVTVLGLLAAWALGQPLAGSDNWWLLTSLLLFVAVGVLVPVVFLPHGKVFEHALADAKARGEVTPELRTALRDPAVRNARAAELVTVAVIITLMVTKPF
jgi:type VI protein secretion system component VasK